MRSKVGAPHEFAKREKTSESIPTILALFSFQRLLRAEINQISESGANRPTFKNDLPTGHTDCDEGQNRLNPHAIMDKAGNEQPGAQIKHPEAAKLVR
jgi:hypothetical protein